MLFFYRRKPKPPVSTLFVPLLKLFETTHRREPKEAEHLAGINIPLDSGSPLLLSGPKSRYGLGISLHFIIIPEKQQINPEVIWHFARLEMRNALLLEGLSEPEADMYTLRLIDPITVPPEVRVEYSKDDLSVLEALQQLVTHQLLQGKRYNGSMEAISTIYMDLADTFISLATNRTPSNSEAAALFEEADFRNIDISIHQEDIEKKAILDIIGKLKEIAKFFELFSQNKNYLKRVTPQKVKVIQLLYP